MRKEDPIALPAEARRYLEQAYLYFGEGKLEDALLRCEMALRYAPEWAEAHNLRGLILRRSGRVDEAVVAFHEALRCDPAFAEARKNLEAAQALGAHQAAAAENAQKARDRAKFYGELAQATPRLLFTPAIIGINVLIFVAMALAGVNPLSPDAQGLLDWGANFGPLTVDGEWWRLLSSTFVHIGILHLVFNMQALWQLGRLGERMFGGWAFLALYVLSGLIGSIASLWWDSSVISAGASGAIFGVSGGLVMFFLLGKKRIPPSVLQRNLTSMLLFVAYNLFYGLMRSNVDNAAHVGGLVSGALMGAVLAWPIPQVRLSPRVRLVLIVVSMVALLALGILIVSGRESAFSHLVRAEELLDAGESDQAIVEAQKVLELDADSAQAYYLLGVAYREQEWYDEAIDALTRAISLEPRDIDLRLERGLTYFVAGHYNEALADLDQAIELDGADSRGYFLRGVVYAEIGDREKAITDLERSLELDLPSPWAEQAEDLLQQLQQ